MTKQSSHLIITIYEEIQLSTIKIFVFSNILYTIDLKTNSKENRF